MSAHNLIGSLPCILSALHEEHQSGSATNSGLILHQVNQLAAWWETYQSHMHTKEQSDTPWSKQRFGEPSLPKVLIPVVELLAHMAGSSLF